MSSEWRQACVQLAELEAGDGGGDGPVGPADLLRGIGLEVPGVEVTGPAAEPEEDTGLPGRASAHRSILVHTGGNQLRPGETHGTDPAGLEQPAAREQSVVQRKHGPSSFNGCIRHRSPSSSHCDALEGLESREMLIYTAIVSRGLAERKG